MKFSWPLRKITHYNGGGIKRKRLHRNAASFKIQYPMKNQGEATLWKRLLQEKSVLWIIK